MTEITHRRLLKIAAPVVLSNATVPILGAVDAGVVGQLGQAAPLAAVGVGSVILTTLYWVFGFLRMGTSGLAAQAHGAGDAPETAAILLRALAIAAAAGLVMIVAQALLFAAAFAIAPVSTQAETLAHSYLAIRIWGAPATIAAYAITGWLIAIERTRGVLWMQLWINGINVVLDLWFVLSLDWGVAGVAKATLIAEWSGLFIGLWLCRDGVLPALGAAIARMADRAALWRMAVVNRDILIRSVLLQASFTAFVFLGARYGDGTLAANHVLMQFFAIIAYALDGFAFGAETLVGQAIGARSVTQARQASRLAMTWGIGGGVLLGLVFGLGGGVIIDLMTNAPEVRVEARIYLPWLVIAPVIGSVAWILDGIFIGATLTVEMRRAMILSVAVYAVAVVVLLPFGNHGLWLAMMVLNAARGVTLARRWSSVAARAA